MDLRSTSRCAILPALAAAVLSSVASAQGPPAGPGAPPWIAHSTRFLMAIVTVDADRASALVPAGVEIVANAERRVNATIEIYETARTAGIPNYRTAFIVLDVQGHDSRTGVPGHFAVWGRTGSPEALDVFRRHFGFPYEQADAIVFQTEGQHHVATVRGPGPRMLRLAIEPADQPFAAEGAVNMVGVKENRVVRSEVPFLTRGHTGKTAALDVRAGGDAVLDLIAGATPVWSMVSSDQTFSYSRATAAP